MRLTDDPVGRLRADVERLTGETAGLRFGVAVSGGPDSMALLDLTIRAFPGCVEAATVDHGLRAEAAGEAAMVARWCAEHGIAHETLRPAVPITGNIQSAARAARYALLHDWRQRRGIDWLMTAHHADDQAETLLMRLNRGAGVSGLAGIRARSEAVLRPVLGWRRAELAQYVADAGLPVVQDPSNDDPRFDRVVMRGHLAQAGWIDPISLARSASALRDAEEAILFVTRQLVDSHVRADGEGWRLEDMDALPHEYRRRLVLHLLDGAGEPAPRGESLEYALQAALHGRQASIGRWLLRGGASWSLQPAPARRSLLGK